MTNHLTLQDQLDIQKCVDGELARDRTRHLLERLDQITNGWKHLAGELLLDRELKSRLLATQSNSELEQQEATTHAVPSSVPKDAGPAEQATRWYPRYRGGSQASMLVSAVLAFVAGLWLPFVFGTARTSPVTDPMTASALTPQTNDRASANPKSTEGIIRPPGDVRLQFVSDNGGDSETLMEVPVRQLDSDQSQQLFDRRLGVHDVHFPIPSDMGSEPVRRTTRLLRIPYGDSVILIPVEEFHYATPMQ
ncbi:MAG: hypothetical protein KDA85_19145 [Planctomycetaceae bacterium]|nr:hypothetical protein [Planctomycetaceae bacterium]